VALKFVKLSVTSADATDASTATAAPETSMHLMMDYKG
jgi:hypothetical protein